MINLALMTVVGSGQRMLSDGSWRWNRVKEVEFPLILAVVSSSHGALSDPSWDHTPNLKACFEAKGSSWSTIGTIVMTNFLSTGSAAMNDPADLLGPDPNDGVAGGPSTRLPEASRLP